MKRLEGKSIVITGGTKGVGRGIAVAAAMEGASVTIAGRDDQAAAEVLSEIKTNFGMDALYISGDLRQPDGCRKLIEAAEDAFGGIDGLFNYAGILPSSTLTETREQMFDDVFSIDVKAPFFCCKYAVASMLRRGGGSIVNTGSIHAYAGEIDRAAYACAKGALLTLTKHISANYARDRIRCNWITMGWVPTPGELALRQAEGRDKQWLARVAREVMPMGRLQTVEDHIEPILYLLSDASSQVTGSEFQMTGGFTPSVPLYSRAEDEV
jgi:NAD(P)-dependent dehydrogenase (short-subunit alcohol dehydrogenase family)